MIHTNISKSKIFKVFILFFLQVEFVDMHYGSELDPIKNPFLFAEHLDEIRNCRAVSRGCFFLVPTFYIL